MSYHVLKNTWVGVTLEPKYQRENYFVCSNLVNDCEDEAPKNHCDKYHKIEGRYFIPCKNKNKNKCKANTDSKIKIAKYDPYDEGTNLCFTDLFEGKGYTCGEPCDPYSYFTETNKCSKYSGMGDEQLKNCLTSYKTETPTDGDPYNVYCKAVFTDHSRFDCKPDDKRMNPPLAPAAAPV